MRKSRCPYSWYDKQLHLVYCPKSGQYCNYKDCPFKDEFQKNC